MNKFVRTRKTLLQPLWWGAAAIGLAQVSPLRAQSAGDAAMGQQASSGSPIPTIVVEGARIQSPAVSFSGTNDYSITSQDILNMPAGENTVLTDVLAQLPGVGIDQNQQVHIRNTEGSGFQYQINGVLIPLDINTNPPFISMLNPLFIKSLDLIDGILPARYSYATGGVVDIRTKDGGESLEFKIEQRTMTFKYNKDKSNKDINRSATISAVQKDIQDIRQIRNQLEAK